MMNVHPLKPVIIGFVVLMALPVTAEPLWLSDAPPNAELAKRLRGSHGGLIEMDREGNTAKRLWLRAGDSVSRAAYETAEETQARSYRLTNPDRSVSEPEPFAVEEGVGVYFPMPEEGFYNAYAIEQKLEDGVLHVQVAKSEVLRHLCSAGHDHIARLMAPRLLPDAPFEIVRERLPKENFHTHIVPGDTVIFRVLHRGRPAPGAEVRIVTGRDWSRTVTTDAAGRARFQMIRDYYPEWTEFNRRRNDGFLVVAEYAAEEHGEYKGEHYHEVRYTATLPGTYAPPPREYQSYAYGLGVALFTFTLGSAGVYLYRRRRWSPPREEAFDERA
jgi:hypothetical protein